MKKHRQKHLIWAALYLLGADLQAAELPSNAPPLDQSGRFWVYRNGITKPLMPFSPYGWMSDASPASVIKLDLECHDSPHVLSSPSTAIEDNVCARLTINWTNATWAAVAFIAGADNPAWWGYTNGGTHYDLRKLHEKKLIVHLRGEKGGERVTIQLGVLARRPFGDSLDKPIVSEPLELSTSWQRYEVELARQPLETLSRICNGFGILVERSRQPGDSTRMGFYLDDIYFE